MEGCLREFDEDETNLYLCLRVFCKMCGWVHEWVSECTCCGCGFTVRM
jgi:hypothetical protein